MVMFKANTRKYLCRLEGLHDQKYMLFATVLCLIPENVRAPVKIHVTENGLATGCQLFYRKIYGYFCSVSMKLVSYAIAKKQ